MNAGLTGGIGSGKSVVARIFAILGWQVFNADEAARALYYDSEVKKEVISLIGSSAYLADGTLNKAAIRDAMLSGRSDAINAIIHPRVIEQFRRFTSEANGRPVLRESALLFEAGAEKHVDKVIVVTAPDEIRIARVMARDGISREMVQHLMSRQWSQEKKAAAADFVIANDEQQFLVPQVIRVHEQLLSLK